MDTVKRLKVVYAADGVDSELDARIEEALSGLGFDRYASGYDLRKGERDLAFDREDESDKYSTRTWDEHTDTGSVKTHCRINLRDLPSGEALMKAIQEA
jgi:hypothetical protein